MTERSSQHTNADLNWLLKAPSLLAPRTDVRLFNPLQLDSTALLPELSSPMRLGHYAEWLVQQWLGQCRQVTALAHNVTIYQKRRSLGELDLVYRDKEDSWHHLELAIKYYLFDPAVEGELGCFVGPNRKDTLARKLAKLTDHQLPIALSDEGRETLANLGIEQLASQQLWLTGRLFYPAKLMDSQSSAINPTHLRGWWRSFTELKQYIEQNPQHSWRQLDRSEWLSGFSQQPSWLSGGQLLESLQPLVRPTQLIERSASQLSYGFVVEDDWSSQGLASF